MKKIITSRSPAVLLAIVLALALGTGSAVADMVAVVSVHNPVTTLSKNQVLAIFLGATTRFPDGRRAVPIDQAEGSTARNAFYLKFAGKSPAQIKAHWSKIIFTGRGQPPREVANSAEVKQYLAEHPEAIGYIDHTQVDDSVKVVLPPNQPVD
ncbi:MAG: phosphate ABC transporter substrate-binding protein [Gammaproteobacteria bacterium]